MPAEGADHTLEFLLEFDGRRHFYEDGSFLKFAVKRVPGSVRTPHGLRYSFTLHDPDGERLMGFDNAHPRNGRILSDHWHRSTKDVGRPYRYIDARTLLIDFFREVERIRAERGVAGDVVKVESKRK